jgi:chromosome segregation ATPase
VEHPSSEELAANIAALEEERSKAAARLREAEERAAALAEELAETGNRAELARRTIAEFEARVAEQREALATAEAFEAAYRQLSVALEHRDESARRLAAVARQLLAQLDELDAARAALRSAQRDLTSRYGRATGDSHETPPEPEELADAWNALRSRLRDEIGRNLDEELLEAATTSLLPSAIDDLPPHLREAARRRLLERRRAPRPTGS